MTPALTIVDGQLLRHGEPHQILSGAIHYFRVHPDLWRDRLTRLRALGLNTIDTYVAWNFHQPSRDAAPQWDGWRDLVQFVEIAGELGLDVMLRPGPYICAEWANGGLPTWVTDTPGIAPRTSDPKFLDLLEPWLDDLLPRIAPLQSVHGGPITSVQIENEYGSYGDDATYLAWLRDALVDRGIHELLFTADGPTDLMLDAGTLPDVWATATFGSDPQAAEKLLRERRTGEPVLCAEFWNGWFDHWGEHHHIRTPESVTADVGDLLRAGGSVNLYMAHGGSNFGLWAGANHDGTRIQPTITSYDSDAPIAEHGVFTDKGLALRELFGEIGEQYGASVPPIPAAPTVLPPQELAVRPGHPFLHRLGAAGHAITTVRPPTFADLNQSAGLLLHRAQPVIPRGPHQIRLLDLHDRAYIYVDGACIGSVDDTTAEAGLTIEGTGDRITLELLVEDVGRINYGPLLGQDKGILGGVAIDRRLVHHWQTWQLPLHEWSHSDLSDEATALDGDVDVPVFEGTAETGTPTASQPSGLASSPSRQAHPRSSADIPVSALAHLTAPVTFARFAHAELHLEQTADTFVALPGFGRGFLWVNSQLIGRYDEVGPQVTTYVPAPFLRVGENHITVLELEHLGTHVELRAEPELGPPEPYVETFA